MNKMNQQRQEEERGAKKAAYRHKEGVSATEPKQEEAKKNSPVSECRLIAWRLDSGDSGRKGWIGAQWRRYSDW